MAGTPDASAPRTPSAPSASADSMPAFAQTLERLVYTPSRNAKLKLLADYFAATPDPARGWALAVLTDELELALPVRRIFTDLMAERVDPYLFRLSRDYVGDTAETVALLWPEPEEVRPAPTVTEVVEGVREAGRLGTAALLEGWLDSLDVTGRWALLKLLTGALRVGVSARLAKTALAQYATSVSGEEVPVNAIEELWHGIDAPYGELFGWIEGRGPKPDISNAPVFRPLMLANPLEDRDYEGLDYESFLAEWKWDGIRVQIVGNGSDVRIYSRTGDDISPAFPDIAGRFFVDAVVDGELLIVRDGEVRPFNDLQQRLNRKTVSTRMMRELPAHVRLYDLLFEEGEDLRGLGFAERRKRLEAWHAAHGPDRSDLSSLIEAPTKEALRQIWDETRGNAIEGLMLKRHDSPYLPGRPKGHWYKWKRAPLTLDVVLMYAQRGSGKRSSYYSDFTFGAWRPREEGGEEDGEELVPVGKAYSGYTDEELLKIDKWVRNNTVDRHGPVRVVKPEFVLEVAFDAVHRSKRHKSGVAMRFPRIHRLRWDKPAHEADRLATLLDMIEQDGR